MTCSLSPGRAFVCASLRARARRSALPLLVESASGDDVAAGLLAWREAVLLAAQLAVTRRTP
jgi:hypothetical protein